MIVFALGFILGCFVCAFINDNGHLLVAIQHHEDKITAMGKAGAKLRAVAVAHAMTTVHKQGLTANAIVEWDRAAGI